MNVFRAARIHDITFDSDDNAANSGWGPRV
jgi:hypothetical protein